MTMIKAMEIMVCSIDAFLDMTDRDVFFRLLSHYVGGLARGGQSLQIPGSLPVACVAGI